MSEVKVDNQRQFSQSMVLVVYMSWTDCCSFTMILDDAMIG
jgi:hypothetical protein